MSKDEIIVVGGFGDLEDEEQFSQVEEIKQKVAELNLEFYPTYYDWEIKGRKDTIQKFFSEMWGMKDEEEWLENGFTIFNEDRTKTFIWGWFDKNNKRLTMEEIINSKWQVVHYGQLVESEEN